MKFYIRNKPWFSRHHLMTTTCVLLWCMRRVLTDSERWSLQCQCSLLCQSHPKPKKKSHPPSWHWCKTTTQNTELPTWCCSWLLPAAIPIIIPISVKSAGLIRETQRSKALVILPIHTNYCVRTANISDGLWFHLFHLSFSTSLNKFLSCLWMLIFFCQYFHFAPCPLALKLRHFRIPHACFKFISLLSDGILLHTVFDSEYLKTEFVPEL